MGCCSLWLIDGVPLVMNTISVYGLKNCDNCKKLVAALKNADLMVELVDFRQSPPTVAQVEAWLNQFGAQKLLNRASTTWRQLDRETQALADGNGLVALLVEHPTLIKRPISEVNGQIFMGHDEKNKAAIIAALESN